MSAIGQDSQATIHATPNTQYAIRNTQDVSRITQHATALAALLLVGLIYLTAVILLPPEALTHHDEGAKYLQVRNLRLAPFGLDWSINYPARRLDPQLEFVPFHPKQHYVDEQGRIYLQWPIFLGLLTRVFWKTMGFWGLYVVPLVAGLGTAWASYLLALAVGVPKRAAWLLVLVVGLATPVAIYSMLYFEHTLAALLVVLSLLAAVRALHKGDVRVSQPTIEESVGGHPQTPVRDFAPALRTVALSGVLLAAAVYFRSELYVLALVMALAFAFVGWKQGSWKPAAVWVGAFALSLVPLWAFYAINEGTLLPAHALWYFTGGEPSNAGGIPKPGLPALRYIASAGWGVIPAFLFGPRDAPLAPAFPSWVEVAGLVGVGLCVVAALGRVLRLALAWRVWVFIAGAILVLVASAATLFSAKPYYNLHGFLLASPFIVMALWPTTSDDAGRPITPAGFLLAVSLLYVGLHALVISALSGLGPISLHEWGQRYLLPAYPLLAVLAVLAVSQSKIQNLISKILLVALVLIGVGFTARGYVVLAEERAQVADWLALTRQLPANEPLVTDVWWLPLNLAAEFYSRPMMLAEGDARLADWAEKMRGKGVTEFGFATTAPAVFTGPWTRQVPGLQAVGPPKESHGVWLQRYTLRS